MSTSQAKPASDSIHMRPTMPACRLVPMPMMIARLKLLIAVIGEGEVRQGDAWRIELNTSSQRVQHCVGLLMDLLEHEMLVLAFCRSKGAVGDTRGGFLHCGAVYAGVLHLFPRNCRHLTNGKVGNVSDVRKQGGDVAGEQHFALTVADDDAARVAELE